jgi:hypothetical protein
MFSCCCVKTTGEAPSKQCSAITVKGNRCKKSSVGEDGLCNQHKKISLNVKAHDEPERAFDETKDVRVAKGRLKSKVFLRIRGVDNLKFVEKKISHLVRDSNISSYREKILKVRGEDAFYTNTRLGLRTRSMAYAEALDPLNTVSTRQLIHVDHTLECQQLAHCIVQTEAFHENNGILLSSVDINVGSDVLSKQPVVVRNFLAPLYSVQNCSEDPTLFNLRLLDDSLNESKGQIVKNFISSRYNTLSKIEHVSGFRSGFRECAAVKDGRISREDADVLANILSKEMVQISDTYCNRLEEKGKVPMYSIYTSPAASSQQDRRIDGLSESIKKLCSEIEDES